MGGVNKAELTLNGYAFRDRILLALISVPQIIVVGPTFPAENPKISFTREQPIGGGPKRIHDFYTCLGNYRLPVTGSFFI